MLIQRLHLFSMKLIECWVVKFNQDQQRELAGGIRSATAGFVASLRTKIRENLDLMKSWVSSIWSGGPWVLLLRLAILAGFVYMAIRWGPILIFRFAELRSARTGRLDPVRKKAGVWTRRIEIVKPPDLDNPQGDILVWKQIHLDLLNLRYGDRMQWPDYQNVFKNAKTFLKKRK